MMPFSDELSVLARQIFDGRATERSIEYARHALLDYLAVTLAGSREPLAAKLLAAIPNGESGACTLIGLNKRANAADASLVNGALGHALDFDDVNSRAVGHPSVVILPALLAEAERNLRDEGELLRAVVAANEVGALIGERFGAQSYRRGFHTTGTIGTMAAAAGVALLRGANQDQLVRALSLAATQASGLKAMFGFEAKPLNAGFAARNGLIAADLAMEGVSAPEDAILARGGLVETMSDLSTDTPLPSIDELVASGFAVEQMLYKYHAACYLTHATIEATRQLAAEHSLTLEDLVSAEIRSHSTLSGVCDIVAPKTGLNVKFSIRMMLLLALDDRRTGELGLYTEETALDPKYQTRMGRVTLIGDDTYTAKQSQVTLMLTSGRTVTGFADMGDPDPDPIHQQRRLTEKAADLIAPAFGAEKLDAILNSVLPAGAAPAAAGGLRTLWKELT